MRIFFRRPANSAPGAKNQKFFGSFLQKRTDFLESTSFVNKTILRLLALAARLKIERQIINASFQKLPAEEAVVVSGALVNPAL
jgi:hypothetical protein